MNLSLKASLAAVKQALTLQSDPDDDHSIRSLDDDIMSLEEPPAISPVQKQPAFMSPIGSPRGPFVQQYPGFKVFSRWLEEEFPTNIIPLGTTGFLSSFGVNSETQLRILYQSKAQYFLQKLGPEKYDEFRNTLVEIKTIYNFAMEQPMDVPRYPYQQFMDFREQHKPRYLDGLPPSSDFLAHSGCLSLLKPVPDRRLLAPYRPASGQLQARSSPSGTKVSPKLTTPLPSMPPKYTPKSEPLLQDPPQDRSEDGTQTVASYHTQSPTMTWGDKFYKIEGQAPALWGASNSNWHRCLRQGNPPNPNQGEPPSPSPLLRSPGISPPRRTSGGSVGGGSSPSLSGHSQRSFPGPRSRNVTKPQANLSERVLWDGKLGTFEQYKAAIHGHLMQVHASYLVQKLFQLLYVNH
jgi:hypothetical protein